MSRRIRYDENDRKRTVYAIEVLTLVFNKFLERLPDFSTSHSKAYSKEITKTIKKKETIAPNKFKKLIKENKTIRDTIDNFRNSGKTQEEIAEELYDNKDVDVILPGVFSGAGVRRIKRRMIPGTLSGYVDKLKKREMVEPSAPPQDSKIALLIDEFLEPELKTPPVDALNPMREAQLRLDRMREDAKVIVPIDSPEIKESKTEIKPLVITPVVEKEITKIFDEEKKPPVKPKLSNLEKEIIDEMAQFVVRERASPYLELSVPFVDRGRIGYLGVPLRQEAVSLGLLYIGSWLKRLGLPVSEDQVINISEIGSVGVSALLDSIYGLDRKVKLTSKELKKQEIILFNTITSDLSLSESDKKVLLAGLDRDDKDMLSQLYKLITTREKLQDENFIQMSRGVSKKRIRGTRLRAIRRALFIERWRAYYKLSGLRKFETKMSSGAVLFIKRVKDEMAKIQIKSRIKSLVKDLIKKFQTKTDTQEPEAPRQSPMETSGLGDQLRIGATPSVIPEQLRIGAPPSVIPEQLRIGAPPVENVDFNIGSRNVMVPALIASKKIKDAYSITEKEMSSALSPMPIKSPPLMLKTDSILETPIITPEVKTVNSQWGAKTIAPSTEILEPTEVGLIQSNFAYNMFDFLPEGETPNGNPTNNPLLRQQQLHNDLVHLDWQKQIKQQELIYLKSLPKPVKLVRMTNSDFNVSEFESNNFTPYQTPEYESAYRFLTNNRGTNNELKKSQLYGVQMESY